MIVVVCDFADCAESATMHVEVLSAEFEGYEFDACSFSHAENHYDTLYTLPLDDEAEA